MAETSETSHPEPGVTKKRGLLVILLDWGYRVLLGLCALPALMSALFVITYFAHSNSGPVKLLLFAPIPLACIVLMLPWRILMKTRVMRVVTLLAACLATQRLYALTTAFKTLHRSRNFFLFCCLILAMGIVSLVLYTHRTKRKMWPIVLGTGLVVVSFIFGTGNPQWSRYIFIWQVYYSPWRTDAANLPTNRGGTREVLPKYTEWDARGRKTAEWTHPDGHLLRTVYYPSGQKRMERLYANGQFVTAWYPDGQMEYHYDRQTRQRRAWDRNGTPRDGEVHETITGTKVIRQYRDGYLHGVHRYWHSHDDLLRREEPYVEGRLHGVRKEWNNKGVLTSEEYYVDDYRHGPRRRFREDGSLEWEETYERGVLKGQRRKFPAPKPDE